MRSQVQVLAGPPAIVAGQSAAGSELGALATGLGRAGAARPSRPAPPVAPPGPPTRPSGSATTTHRGRAPSSRMAATRRVQPPRAAACSRAHSAAAREGRSDRRPGLPGRSGQAWPLRPAPNRQPGSATDLPLTNATSAASPASQPPRPLIEPSPARRPPGSPPVPVVTVARPPRPGPDRHRLRWRRRTRPDGWGQTPDGWTPDGWTAYGRPPDRLDDDPRGPDTGRLDSRIPDADTGGVDTACWTPATDAVAWLLAVSTTATTPDLAIPA